MYNLTELNGGYLNIIQQKKIHFKLHSVIKIL
jgi:hypothetical protein